LANPPDLRYHKEHTWAKVEGSTATIGITDYAQEQLGNIVFLELASAGDTVTQSTSCGTVESEKASSDIICPVTGAVEEVNGEVLDAPEIVNKDPYGAGWMLKVRLTDTTHLDNLVSAEEYEVSTS